jgi:hypothetical protein
MKARAGVTTTLRLPETRSRPKEEKDPLMRTEQTVSEVAQEVLWRQERALAQRTGVSFVKASSSRATQSLLRNCGRTQKT